jgi:alanine dehydrogenase
MPGAVPATSTVALTNATLPYVLAIAGKGWKKALQDDAALALGLNAHEGVVTHPAVQHAFPELAYKTASEVISAS